MTLTKDQIMMICLTIVLAVLSTVNIMLLRSVIKGEDQRDIIIKEIKDTQVQTQPFADYVHCLFIVDQNRVSEIGLNAYARECERHLRPQVDSN